MSAMLARSPSRVVSSVPALHHARALGRRGRVAASAAVVPVRTGILILDETSFPKSGPHSVGVARHYCGALGKVANCQVAVTAALWTGQRAWPLGALVMCRKMDARARRRAAAGIPAALGFQEKWRSRADVVAPQPGRGGDDSPPSWPTRNLAIPIRGTLHRCVALCVRHLVDVDRLSWGPRRGSTATSGGRATAGWAGSTRSPSPSGCQRRAAAHAWRRMAWRNGTHPPWEAEFAALRVSPPSSGGAAGSPRSVGSSANGASARRGAGSHYFVSLPPTASLTAARPARTSTLGDRAALPGPQDRARFGSLRGPDVPGMRTSPVITAMAYTFLQKERLAALRRSRAHLSGVRAIVEETFTGLLFISRPRYMQWMKQAEHRFRQLRI